MIMTRVWLWMVLTLTNMFSWVGKGKCFQFCRWKACAVIKFYFTQFQSLVDKAVANKDQSQWISCLHYILPFPESTEQGKAESHWSGIFETVGTGTEATAVTAATVESKLALKLLLMHVWLKLQTYLYCPLFHGSFFFFSLVMCQWTEYKNARGVQMNWEIQNKNYLSTEPFFVINEPL